MCALTFSGCFAGVEHGYARCAATTPRLLTLDSSITKTLVQAVAAEVAHRAYAGGVAARVAQEQARAATELD